MKNLKVKLANLELQNPVVTASGTFGNGFEFKEFLDLDKLGAITLKSISKEERVGNPPPRVVETPSGMINSIGLANPGLKVMQRDILPKLGKFKKVKVIVNIAGHTIEENIELAEALNKEKRVDALELNISCPNVEAGGLAFCFDLKVVKEMVKGVKAAFNRPLIVKLSASVPDIVALADVSVDAGADILSLINSIPGMEFDLDSRGLYFSRGFGGLSGPAIRPIALKAVYDVSQSCDIPIIGMGGVATVEDIVRFILAGSTAVSVGMMNFVNPKISSELVVGLGKYLSKFNLSLKDLRLI